MLWIRFNNWLVSICIDNSSKCKNTTCKLSNPECQKYLNHNLLLLNYYICSYKNCSHAEQGTRGVNSPNLPMYHVAVTILKVNIMMKW